MLKREDDTEKNEKLEKFNSKYNIDELFSEIVLKKKKKIEKNNDSKKQ